MGVQRGRKESSGYKLVGRLEEEQFGRYVLSFGQIREMNVVLYYIVVGFWIIMIYILRKLGEWNEFFIIKEIQVNGKIYAYFLIGRYLMFIVKILVVFYKQV